MITPKTYHWGQRKDRVVMMHSSGQDLCAGHDLHPLGSIKKANHDFGMTELERRCKMGTHKRQDDRRGVRGSQLLERFDDNNRHQQQSVQQLVSTREYSRTTSTRNDATMTLKSQSASIVPWKQLLEVNRHKERSNYETIYTKTQEMSIFPSWDTVELESPSKQTIHQQELDANCATTTSQTTNDSFLLEQDSLERCSLEHAKSEQAAQTHANELHKTIQLYRHNHNLQDDTKKNQEDKEPKQEDREQQEKLRLYASYGLTCPDGRNDHLPRPFHPAVGRPTNLMASVNDVQDYQDAPQVVETGLANGNEYGMHPVVTLPSLCPTFPTFMSEEQEPPLASFASYQYSWRHPSTSAPLSLGNNNIDHAPDECLHSRHSSSSPFSPPFPDSDMQSLVAALSLTGPSIYVQPKFQLFLPQGRQQDFVHWQMTDLDAGNQGVSTDTASSFRTRIHVPPLPIFDPFFVSAHDVPRSEDEGIWNNKKERDSTPHPSFDDERGGDDSASKVAMYKVDASPPLKPLSAYNFFYAELRDWIICLNDADRDRLALDEQPDSQRNWSLARVMILDLCTTHTQDERKRRLLSNHWNKDRKTRRKHRVIHGKVSFNRMNKIVSSGWKALLLVDKEFYKEVASADKKRYSEQVRARRGTKHCVMKRSPNAWS